MPILPSPDLPPPPFLHPVLVSSTWTSFYYPQPPKHHTSALLLMDENWFHAIDPVCNGCGRPLYNILLIFTPSGAWLDTGAKCGTSTHTSSLTGR